MRKRAGSASLVTMCDGVQTRVSRVMEQSLHATEVDRGGADGRIALTGRWMKLVVYGVDAGEGGWVNANTTVRRAARASGQAGAQQSRAGIFKIQVDAIRRALLSPPLLLTRVSRKLDHYRRAPSLRTPQARLGPSLLRAVTWGWLCVSVGRASK